MKKIQWFFCMIISSFFTAQTYDADQIASMRRLEDEYKNCMQQRDNYSTAEMCIYNYTTGLIRNGLLSKKTVEERKQYWMNLYRNGSAGYTGFGILHTSGLSVDALIKASQESEKREEKEERKNNLAQAFQAQLIECYQRAGNNNAKIQDCWQLYKESMQANGLQVPENLQLQRQQNNNTVWWRWFGW